jgi:hypothetical protein
MAERRHGSGVPAGLELRVEVHWCAQCRAERTVQIVQLAADPEPIAICVDCGTGVDMWLSAELVEPPARPASHRDEPSAGRQGAA